MQTIDHIHTVDELKRYRDHVDTVLARNLGSPVTGRKLDDLAAQLAGARNWNTALGMIKASKSEQEVQPIPRPTGQTNLAIWGWYSVCLGLIKDNYLSEDELQAFMDDAVDDLVGTSQWISDNVNNRGFEAQISAICGEMSLPHLHERLSEETGITMDDLNECVKAAMVHLRDHPGDRETPFDVTAHVNY